MLTSIVAYTKLRYTKNY